MNCVPKIGDVYWMQFTGTGSEQSGVRPGVIFQNNVGNKFSPCVIALPITTAIKKLNQPTHVFVSAKESGLSKDSVVLAENPQRMAKENLGKYITTLSPKQMREVAKANILASSAICFIPFEELRSIQQKARLLNAQ